MSNVLGHHFLIEMYDCDAQLLNDVADIQTQMLNVAVSCQMTIIQHYFHHFTPHGISGFIVIAESHLAIHTWPEYGYAAVDLFTCGRIDLLESCLQKLRENFQCQRISAVKVMRGDKVAPERIAPLFLETELRYEQIEARARAVAPQASYQPLHPDLFHYDGNFVERFIAPEMAFPRAQRWRNAMTEVAEQVYLFQLFQPEFCRWLIEEAEHCGQWRTAADVEPNPYCDIKEYCEPDTTLHLDKMSGLEAVYQQIIRQHLQPLMEQIWVTFKLQKISPPYVLKYAAEPNEIRAMALHHDLETLTLVTYLNDEFTGGGTYFPRWKYHTAKPTPGSAILYPGGLSHEHEGLAITSGKRYLLCGSFY